MIKKNTAFSTVLLGASLLLIGGAATADSTKRTTEYPQYPKIDYRKVANPDLVRRGEYVAKAGDCLACHTAPESNQTYAGGLPFASPLGTMYTPNITGDKETGIGKWTEAQFAKAMREGVSPDGSFYYPAFPYLYFNNMTDADLKALFAYLKAVPAYKVANKKNDMMFPFNIRFLQLGWRMLFFYPHNDGAYKPDPKQSAQWNRGKYLVRGLGHCEMCHTKSYYLFTESMPLAAPIRKYDLAGGKVETYVAPDITSNLMKNASLKEITNVFMKDELIGGGKVAQAPMLEVNHVSLSHLAISDLEAIGIYLKTVKSETPPISTSGDHPGEGIYSTYCAGCHTTGAGGAPKLGDKTAWTPRIKQGIEKLYSNAINGFNSMPRKGNCASCTDKQIDDAVDYLVSQAESGTASSAPAVAPMERLTLVDGKKIYQAECAACHAPRTRYLNAPAIGDRDAWSKIIGQGMDQVIAHTLNGYGNMAAKGACTHCSDEEVIVAIKYMVNQSKRKGNYQLW